MSNLFKSFTPYLNNVNGQFRAAHFNEFDEHEACDPSPSSWSSIGFVEVQTGELFLDVQGAGFVAMVQYNERILPGSVQKEKIAERLADIEHRDGRKPGKKEYAQVRDDVILELLPMALIKRKSIPVLFLKDKLFIFTTSAKRCDDVLLLLNRSMPDGTLAPSHLQNCVTNDIAGTLTTLAKEGSTQPNGGNEGYDGNLFETTDVAVLKGENKQTIRIKDKMIDEADVQALLKKDYSVTALGLNFIEAGDSDPAAEITINDKLTITRMVLNGVKNVSEKDEKDQADTFMASAWLTCRLSVAVVDLLIETMGGLRGDEAEEKELDDDDEL